MKPLMLRKIYHEPISTNLINNTPRPDYHRDTPLNRGLL